MRLVLAPWEWHVDAAGEGGWRKPGNDYTGGCLDLRSNAEAGTPGPVPSGLGLFAYETLPVGLVPVADLGDDPLARMRVVERNALADALGLARAGMPDATLAAVLAEHVLGAVADPTGTTRVKPLRMNGKGAALHLKGFGQRLWSSPLDSAHPNYTRTLQVRRADYARERVRLLAMWRAKALARGLDPDAAEARALLQLRKWTGWDMRALGITDETLLLPTAYFADGYAAPATTLTETWPTNSTTISSGQDNPWTEEVQDFEVLLGQIGRAATGAFGVISCDTALSSDDMRHAATSTMTALLNMYNGVLARYDALVSGNLALNTYGLDMGRESGEVYLFKLVAAARTNIDSEASDPGSPVTIECKTLNSEITGIAGALTLSNTDPALTGYLQCGCQMRRTAGSVHANATLDNHTFEDVPTWQPRALGAFNYQPYLAQ